MSPSGVLVVDKPARMTSHDVVDAVRRRLSMRRVGHLGTLDPAATGVLPLTLGRATRLARFIPTSPKEYTGEIHLGWDTTTCDLDGEPLGDPRPVELGSAAIVEAMNTFVGDIEQVPPAFSAKKLAGVRAYRLARKGREVRLDPIRVQVREFVLSGFDPPRVSFRVVCSGGTYVRSLARDLGAKLGTGGHLHSLRRTRSGPFGLEGAVALEEARPGAVIPLEALMEDLPRIEVEDDHVELARNGRPIPVGGEGPTVRIFNKKGQLIAVASVEKGFAHPRVVLL